jgi:hypothetical protein
MKIVLEPPVWYSKDGLYVANVKETDAVIMSEPMDLSTKGTLVAPKVDPIVHKSLIAKTLLEQTYSWFSTPIEQSSFEKRLTFEFIPLEYTPESRWVQVKWIPKHLQIHSKGRFVCTFIVDSFVDTVPRIPKEFLGSMTPRAWSPIEEKETPLRNQVTVPVAAAAASAPDQVRKILIQPGSMGSDLEDMNDMPLVESGMASIELRSEHQSHEKQKLRQAKLRAAIARLKVEEMRERYLRKYGDTERFDEYDESDDGSLESDDSDLGSKKL